MSKSIKEILKEDVDILGVEDSARRLPFLQQIVAGSIAGICEHLGLFPVDTVKVRILVIW